MQVLKSLSLFLQHHEGWHHLRHPSGNTTIPTGADSPPKIRSLEIWLRPQKSVPIAEWPIVPQEHHHHLHPALPRYYLVTNCQDQRVHSLTLDMLQLSLQTSNLHLPHWVAYPDVPSKPIRGSVFGSLLYCCLAQGLTPPRNCASFWVPGKWHDIQISPRNSRGVASKSDLWPCNDVRSIYKLNKEAPKRSLNHWKDCGQAHHEGHHYLFRSSGWLLCRSKS